MRCVYHLIIRHDNGQSKMYESFATWLFMYRGHCHVSSRQGNSSCYTIKRSEIQAETVLPTTSTSTSTVTITSIIIVVVVVIIIIIIKKLHDSSEYPTSTPCSGPGLWVTPMASACGSSRHPSTQCI